MVKVFKKPPCHFPSSHNRLQPQQCTGERSRISVPLPTPAIVLEHAVAWAGVSAAQEAEAGCTLARAAWPLQQGFVLENHSSRYVSIQRGFYLSFLENHIFCKH